MKKPSDPVSHREHHTSPSTSPKIEQADSLSLPDVNNPQRNKLLNRRLDYRVLPLCCWVYLLNFLDRGNIGNSKVMNAETGDDLLQQTGMSANGYALTVTLFSVAYAVFEVPSNWIMKHYVRPSVWLGSLLFCWGAVTIGFAGVQNYATGELVALGLGVVG